MKYSIRRRPPCSICGLDTFGQAGWFLVVENRWLDRLRILSWHPTLAIQPDMKSVCCHQHLKALIAHWLTRASLRVSPAQTAPLPMGSDPSVLDFDLGQHAVGGLLGELAVHRESFSHVWSGSPESIECILIALIPTAAENKPPAMELTLLDSALSAHGTLLQSGAGKV